LDDVFWMNRAIEQARAGIALGQSPFGSVIVRDGRAIAETHNTVWLETDPTAHAEVNCLRKAAVARGSIDLAGSTLYSTCEPCPMCLAASHWARVDRVVFGAGIADAARAGFREMPVGAKDLASLGHSPLIVEGGLLLGPCVELFREWERAKLGRSY